MYEQRLAAGRFFTDADVRDTAAVIVVNASLAAHQSPNDPSALLGDTLRANSSPLRVVGVLAADDQSDRPAGAVPLTTGTRVLSASALARPPAMMIEVAELEAMDSARAVTEAWLGEQYGQWSPRLTIGRPRRGWRRRSKGFCFSSCSWGR